MPRHKTKTAASPKPDKLAPLEFGFLQAMDEYFPGTPLSNLNVAQKDALRRIAEQMGANTPDFLVLIVREWISVSAAIKRANEFMLWRIPVPSLSAVARHFDAVIAWMQSAGYAIAAGRMTGKARRAVPVFDPPLAPYDPDENDDDDGPGMITVGELATA